MKPSKNTLALTLIVSSIILLVALQVFWLTNSYEKAYFDLRRETNGMFRTTVMALRDSLLVKNFEKLPPDSVWKEAAKVAHKVEVKADTVNKSNIRLRQSSSQIQIYISSDQKGDSLQTLLRPLSTRIQEGKMSGGNFVLRIGPDSLSSDSIRYYYRKSLAQADIDVPFEVKHFAFIPTPIQLGTGNTFLRRSEENPDEQTEVRVFSNSLYSDWVRFDPVHRYAVVLTDFRPHLIKAITPQILFSAFLTILTTAAFIIMYRSIRSQQRLMALKNDFISNITHELKTPVTTVGVALEAIKNFKGQNNPELTTEYLEIAQNELNRLNILTDKILKTAIFEDKGIEFEAEPVDLSTLLDQVLGSMKLVLEKQKVQIQVEKTGEDFHLLGAPVHLTSVLYNLLDNALKYSLATPQINISLQADKEILTFRIQDNGIGIAPEYKKKVFEKFFRVPTGDVHTIKGYGLGLSYVETVVKSHHGSISVESEPGKGSEFIIRLPRHG